MSADHVPLLEIRDVRKSFRSGGLLSPVKEVTAASDVTFSVDRGEAVALVGESGSGKSTLARIILRLETPDEGSILLDGKETRGGRRALDYRSRVQMVFQDPFGSLNPIHDIAHHIERPLRLHGFGSLNPAHDVSHHVERPLRVHGRGSAEALRDRVLELLSTVGLEPADEFINRRPYELSGGQRQRVAIARALAVEPDLIVADEPTSMLDVSIRMDILNLFAKLKRERNLAILLITHDLASARYLADRVLVLFQGRIVEDGTVDAVIKQAAHPYTRALLDAIADAGDVTIAAAEARDRAPAAEAPGSRTEGGCPFRTRCSEAMDVCRDVDPEPRLVDGRRVRCHVYPVDAAPAGREGVPNGSA
jgi:oligopeptide/dipeptide ABC transporter ATP-binding protein